MNPRMSKGVAPKLYLGIHARLAFFKEEDEWAVPRERWSREPGTPGWSPASGGASPASPTPARRT
jgi:hypothetical protein